MCFYILYKYRLSFKCLNIKIAFEFLHFMHLVEVIEIRIRL